MKYQHKPTIIEAFKWNGHGEEDQPPVLRVKADARILMGKCKLCGETVMKHGRLVGTEVEYRVCPGDYVVKGLDGELYPCSDKVFTQSYEEVKNGEETEPARIAE